MVPALEHVKMFCQAQEPCGPQFCIQLGDEGLVQLMAAAYYLGMDVLLEEACKKVGSTLSNCSVEEIRERFHLTNDISPDELVALQAEEEWLEDCTDAGTDRDELYEVTADAVDQSIEQLPQAREVTDKSREVMLKVLHPSLST